MSEKIRWAIAVVVCLAACLFLAQYDGGALHFLSHETEGKTETVEAEKDKAVQHLSRLPSHFDARQGKRAPTVKNQGEFSTCWAVAASSALEASMLPEEHLIFSAEHISRKNSYGKLEEKGGAYAMLMSYLAGWLGPVPEESDPYGDGKSPDGLSAIRHVQEMQIIQEKNIPAVKELIYRYGAVQASFYMDMEKASHSSVYYNEFAHAYCYAGEQAVNHDVLIIGWDDAYPKENFSVNVKKNGAFLCQNSWGKDFGEDGVFYVSYEDAWMGSSCVAYTRVEETGNYDHLYQTDLCGWVGQIGYNRPECWFSNVYMAGQEEELSAVGFYATGEKTEYTVYVDEKFSGVPSLENCQRVAEGSFRNAGYYTVDFEKPIRLQAGQKFAVLVKIYTPDAAYPAATEYPADENSRNVTIEDGEGYLSPDGVTWQKTEEKYGCNICLKAYTRNGNG